MKQQDKTLPKGVTVQELIGLVPDSLIEGLAGQLVVGKWVRKLKGGCLFKLVLSSILGSERLSLRTMESNFGDPFSRALAPAVAADGVTWTGIRERLMKVNGLFFRKLYEAVYERARELYGGKGLSRYHTKSYDFTMVATFSHLLEGMKVGRTKKDKTQVKLATEFTEGLLILIFKRLNGIKSYKKAKIRFSKELLYLTLLEAMEDPGELERLKSMLKKYVQRE